MTEKELAAIEARHEPQPRNGANWCHTCERELPCDAARLVAEVRRLQKTAWILWDTMNRDTQPIADESLQEAGLPEMESGYR